MFDTSEFASDPDFQRLTAQAQDQVRQNRAMQSQRDQLTAQATQYQTTRDPYYAALRQQTVQSQTPYLQQQYSDALRHQQLSSAQRGTAGGSQDAYQQSLLNSQLQSGLGQADLQGQQLAQQAKGQDQQLINDWLQHAYTITGGEQAATQNRVGGIQDMQNATSQFQQAMAQNSQMNQNIANQKSQVYGNAIGSVGSGIKNIVPFLGG